MRTCWLFVVIGALFWLGCTEGQSAQPRTASAEAETTSTEEKTSRAPDSVATVPFGAAETRSVEQRLQDASRAAQITQALVRERSLRVFDIEVQVVGRTALLQGDVNTKAQHTRAARTARNVSGIEAVQNELTVGGQPIEALTESKAGETTAVYHTVERGETLWDIAEAYNATVDRLRQLNDGIRSSGLQPGQRLRVR